ncbi:hypothetical protein IWQ62_006612, partial [Dispira parvispora]
TALASRVDALSEKEGIEIGIESRAALESRIRELETRFAAKAVKAVRGKSTRTESKIQYKAANDYNQRQDATIAPSKPKPHPVVQAAKIPDEPVSTPTTTDKKRKLEAVEADEDGSTETPSKKKKEKKEKKTKKDKKEKKKKKDE